MICKYQSQWQEVQLTEIKNTETTDSGKTVQHIIIHAQSTKYEQLAYFKAKMKNANVLDNITSTEGQKDGEYVKIIIEGDLKTYQKWRKITSEKNINKHITSTSIGNYGIIHEKWNTCWSISSIQFSRNIRQKSRVNNS